MPGPIYGLTFVHRALENGLVEMAEIAGDLCAAYDAAKHQDLQREVASLSSLLVGHALAEDKVLFPAIDAKDPALTARYFADHETETKNIETLSRMVADWPAAGDTAGLDALARAAEDL